MGSRVGGLVGAHEGEVVSFDLSKDFMLKLKVVFEVELQRGLESGLEN